MNLQELANYLRLNLRSIQRSFYRGDYQDMPRKRIDKVTYKNNRKYSHKEYFFDKNKIYDYLKRKFN